MKRKSFKFSLDSITDAGEFVGYASRSGNVDLGREVVVKGAFTKTLTENPSVVVLWQHRPDEPIGVSLSMIEDGKGLRVKAQLNLETQRGREAYALLKQGAIKGLSIGYDVIVDKVEKGVRYLKELKLWEFSVVTFPMNPLADVDGLKALRGNKFMADTFGDANEGAQLRNAKYTMLDVLSMCLSTAVYGDYSGVTPPTDEEAAAYIDASCAEFRDAAVAWVSAFRAFNADNAAKSVATKNDTDVSYEQRAKVEHHLDALKALLAAPEKAEEPGELPHSTEPDAGNRAADPDNPESDHSETALDALLASVKAATPSAART